MNGRASSKQPNSGGETVLRSGALDPTKPKQKNQEKQWSSIIDYNC